jgi:alpha-tubulin suppressor-like RCC1 family protein
VKCFGAYENRLGRGLNGAFSKDAVHAAGFTSGARGYAVGANGGCAANTAGAVSCWGWNSNGALGTGQGLGSLAVYPQPLTTITKPAVSIAVGFNFGCAVLDDSSVTCWGGNSHGQLGNGGTTDAPLPVAVVP